MTELVLDVRLDGFEDPIGVLVRDERGALAFAYSPAHLGRRDALPLSLSLPLTDEPFGDLAARAFFDNLLQERDGGLAELMARESLTRDDVAGLLFHIGRDCAGALSVLPHGAPPVKVPGDFAKDYRPVSDSTLIDIVRALRDRRGLPDGTNDPSPLAGVQSKIALALLDDGHFAEPLPGSGAPTTHILKVPDREHPRDAALEAATLDFSRALDLDSSEAQAIDIGGIDVLLVQRFDRALDQRGRVVRLHQEDFAQALGLPAALKYERRGKEGRRFDVAGIRRVIEATLDPEAARDTFIRSALFDLMTGNVDNHAKNFAVLHLAPGLTTLAPRYDLLPTRLDPNLTDELAFKIGNATTLDELTRDDLDQFVKALGIGNAAARKRTLARHAKSLAKGLSEMFEELTGKGMKPYADLMAANMRTILPLLGLDVPENARGRDAFVSRGGGWLSSSS